IPTPLILSFAVCFSRRFKGFRGKASSHVGFNPFYRLHLKGLKPTEEPAKPEQSPIRLLQQTAKERLHHKACLT
ncbi:hypothetical protein, partial [uncultured Parabacteroides sp.]|uniref:hypothetical protein n=1 Tax=uncultured Parabacteroides sp. TaxID=512312 RepID=UPI0025D0D355